MMKKFLIAAALLFTGGILQHGFAQTAGEETVKISKQRQNAFTAEYQIDKDVLEVALTDYFSKQNFGKSRSTSGYDKYEGVSWNEISVDKIDVYAKVTGNRNKASITLLLSKGYDNFVGTLNDEAMALRIKTFLNNFMTYTAAAQNAADISVSEDDLKKAEKEYDKIVREGENLVKDKEKIERDIEKNAKEKEDAAKKVEEEKAKLEALKKKQ